MIKERTCNYINKTITIFEVKENTKLIDFYYSNARNVPSHTKINLLKENFRKVIYENWQDLPTENIFYDNLIIKDYIYYPMDDELDILI